MKLLLTSAGLSNSTITKALEELLGKSAQGAKLAFCFNRYNCRYCHWRLATHGRSSHPLYLYRLSFYQLCIIDLEYQRN